MLNLLAISLVSIIVLVFSLRTIYQFQITEYRLDRFKSMLKDAGLFRAIFVPKLVFPAKTIRNLLVMIFSTFFLLLYAALFVMLDSYYLTIAYILTVYLLSKFFVYLGVLLTYPFANLIRRRTIEKAKEMIKDSKTVFIGVTGSYGKSSVKEFLAQVLNKKYKVEYTSGNRNTDIGVALDIVEKYTNDLDFYIIEMGAYSKGEISQICEIVKPKYGIITGLGNQHIDLFGSKENLVEAKSELFDSIPDDGFAIINADSEDYKKALKHANCDVVRYGENPLSEVQILDVKYKGRLSFVKVKYLNHHYQFTTSLLGRHNILNLLGVIGLAMKLNMGFEAIQQAIASINPIPGKLSLHKGVKEITFINDSYNSNVNGFKAALEVMKDMEYSQKYVITNGIFELGKDRENAYSEIKTMAEKYNISILSTDIKFKGAEYFKTESTMLENISEKSLVLIEGRFSPMFMKSLKLRKFKI